MRVLSVLFATALLGITPAWAQHTAPASVGPDLKSPGYRELLLKIGEKGTVYQTIKTTRTETRDGATKVSAMEARYRNDFALGDEGYVVKKTQLSTLITLPDGQKIDDKSTTPEAMLTRTITGSLSEITFIADDSLKPIRVENWSALRDKSRALIVTAMQASLKAPGKDAPADADADAEKALTNAFDTMLGKLSSEQAAELYLRNDTFLSLVHNVGLEQGKPLAMESVVTVPIGNYPMAMREAITLTEWNDAGNTARLTYDFAPTPEALKGFLTDFLPRFMKELGAPENVIKEMEASMLKAPNSAFDLSTHCDYESAIDTGLVRKGTCTRTTTISMAGQNLKRVEAFDFSESFQPQN